MEALEVKILGPLLDSLGIWNLEKTVVNAVLGKCEQQFGSDSTNGGGLRAFK